MKWISVKDRLPEELDCDFHKKKYWVSVEKYGCMPAFFMNGKFWHNYACQINKVTHWMPLPEPPKK